MRDTASGATAEFFTNLFRRRHYEQFDGEDRDDGDDCVDVRDEENNKVYWKKELYSEIKSSQDSEDNGFTTLTLHSYDGEPGSVRRREIPGAREDARDQYGDDNARDIRPREFGSHNYGENRSQPPSQRVSSEVNDFMHSYTQGRYERLDDSDEELNNDDDITKDTRADSGVFRSINDFDSKWSKPKSNRRKKVHIFKLLRRISCLSAENNSYSRKFT